VKRIALSVQTKSFSQISAQELMDAQEAEGNMKLQDKLIAQTAEAMNNLETKVYALRDDLSQKLSAYYTEPDKEKLGSTLTAMEDWLYDEGMDVEKSVYEAKLKELLATFAPGEGRAKEADLRPDAFSELGKAIEKFNIFAASQSEDYAHISTEEKQKVAAECAQAQAWMAEAEAKLQALDKTTDPPIKAAEITSKASSLSAMCTPIMNTPKPLPKEPEPAPAAEVPDDAAAADAATTEPATEPAGEETPASKPDNMDVD